VQKANSLISPEYLAEVLKLPQVRRQIESSVTGSSPTMQNITKPSLLALRFPLPSIRIQEKIISDISEARRKIAEVRATAANLDAKTSHELGEIILNQSPVPGIV
jgi:type I restriction enzyme S subunit